MKLTELLLVTSLAVSAGCAKAPVQPTFNDPVLSHVQHLGKKQTKCDNVGYELDIGPCAKYRDCTVFVDKDSFSVFGQTQNTADLVAASHGLQGREAYHFDLSGMSSKELFGFMLTIASLTNTCDMQKIERELFKYKTPFSKEQETLVHDAYDTIKRKM